MGQVRIARTALNAQSCDDLQKSVKLLFYHGALDRQTQYFLDVSLVVSLERSWVPSQARVAYMESRYMYKSGVSLSPADVGMTGPIDL